MQILLDLFRKSLNQFFALLNIAEVEKAFDVIASCSGTIFLSGVGKSGFIAQKIAATLVSTGVRALFLSPAGALHGDIGIVSEKDLFLSFSKSGESEELVGLIPYIRSRGAITIGIVSHSASRVAKLSDLVVQLPIEKEICPYDLVPTVSTAAQLIFGDCLSIALMQARKFTPSDFASNHPAGFLGRKITLKVSDLMLKDQEIPLCRSEDRLIEILPELTGKRCGCILITNEELHLKGIFTDGDLRRAIHAKAERALQCTMGTLMTCSPRATTADQFAALALRQMEEDKNRVITVLPVLQNKTIVGLLRMHDILQSGLH